jgi:hypothetical protein
MTLTHTGTESDTERWEEPDGSAVEYRGGDGVVLRFEAFTGTIFGLRPKIGARVTAHHGRFEVAEIDSRYFVRVDDQAYDVVHESSNARNATHLEQHESKHGGAASALPERIEALCRAQWRGSRYRYVVSTGQLRPDVVPDTPGFPEDFPRHWPAPGGVEIVTEVLDITGRGLGVPRTVVFTVRNKEATAQTITIHPASHYSFVVDSGDLVIPAGASVRVPVRYRPDQLEVVQGILPIETPSGRHEIELIGRLDLGAPGGAMGGGVA